MADENKYLESEELLLRNTFLNAKTNPNAMTLSVQPCDTKNKKTKLKWKDSLKTDLTEQVSGDRDLINTTNPAKVTSHYQHSCKKTAIKIAKDPI